MTPEQSAALIERLMVDFYVSPSFDLKAERHADTVKAAIAYTVESLTSKAGTDEVVERVAKAISEHTFANTKCGPATDCAEWEDMADYDRTTYRRAARAALATCQPMVEEERWLPIETAPKDGTWFLTFTPGATAMGVAHWYGGGWADSSDPYDGCIEWNITHWQPLPEPPNLPVIEGEG